MAERELDLVLLGATGFTGSLVAEYLAGRYGGELRWALAGRDRAKLQSLAARLRVPGLPVLVADSHAPGSLADLVGRARVVCTTVGPYSLHGSALVAACAEAGTHYCDLAGETHWIRRMIDAHGERAAATGARIVHACGFDSIPSDLGCLFLQHRALDFHGSPCGEVGMRVRRLRGGFSGGTVASMLATLELARRDRDVRRILGDPYCLNPAGERQGADGGDEFRPAKDGLSRGWIAPFVMAPVNTRVVRRSHALLGWPWGREFRYSEAMSTGRGASGFLRAAAVSSALGGFVTAASAAPLRRAMQRLFLPAPGEGPDAEAREAGGFEMLFLGRHAALEAPMRVRVTGQRDPGYGATSRMLGEAAVCLALDAERLPVGGGSWTPATAMGAILIDRLQRAAGLSFAVEPAQ